VPESELGAFVDGELSGADRMRVHQHLAECSNCAAEAEALGELGEVLRTGAGTSDPEPGAFDGLAGGVISRVRAERAQSWHGFLDRCMDDWHYAIVGAGAVTAAFISIAFVSAKRSSPAPERDDSLAALIANLNSPAGTLFVEATPVQRQGPQFDADAGRQRSHHAR
jgi:anti-sigma factor RsiW